MNPLISCIVFHRDLLSGKIRFTKERIGQEILLDGKHYRIFRQVFRKYKGELKPGGLFRVQFKVSTMSPSINKIFSWIPIPFFVGFPGFRSKIWMLDESTGYTAGIYEWQTIEDAENYSNSVAVRFMTRRSEIDSVKIELLANTPENRIWI
jgi:hypothetical protein